LPKENGGSWSGFHGTLQFYGIFSIKEGINSQTGERIAEAILKGDGSL